MSSLKLKHSGGNSVSIAGPSSNPAANRTINLNDNYAGDGSFVTANSSGNVGIGTASPSGVLHVHKADSGTIDGLIITNTSTTNNGLTVGVNSSEQAFFWNGSNTDMTFATNNTERMRINSDGTLISSTAINGQSIYQFRNKDTTSGSSAMTQELHFNFARTGTSDLNLSAARMIAGKEREWVGAASNQDGYLAFHTCGNETPAERMRINSSGDVTVNNTGDLDAYRLAGAGSSLRGHLMRANGLQASTTSGQQLLSLNRLDSDGSLINLIQNGSIEGSISVSGSSVSYNGGVLTRWSQLKGISSTDKSARPTIYQGTVMSNLDDLCEWEGEENQQLNMTKVSDVDSDKDIAGVFWAWDDDDDEIVNDFYIAMTGDMVIRVAASTTVARGDLLISAGDGTAKPQADDIVRSSTIAKIISTNHTATYPDGSKAYPCILMAC